MVRLSDLNNFQATKEMKAINLVPSYISICSQYFQDHVLRVLLVLLPCCISKFSRASFSSLIHCNLAQFNHLRSLFGSLWLFAVSLPKLTIILSFPGLLTLSWQNFLIILRLLTAAVYRSCLWHVWFDVSRNNAKRIPHEVCRLFFFAGLKFLRRYNIKWNTPGWSLLCEQIPGANWPDEQAV